jgi:uncharacterized protein YsxB (DUF464 family)
MTRVRLDRHKDGSFACRAEGHSGFAARGNDIVCAAVTILLRTAAQTLELTEGLTVAPLEAREGILSFCAAKQNTRGNNERLLERLNTAGDFLKAGFRSLADEYPLYVEFTENLEV